MTGMRTMPDKEYQPWISEGSYVLTYMVRCPDCGTLFKRQDTTPEWRFCPYCGKPRTRLQNDVCATGEGVIRI